MKIIIKSSVKFRWINKLPFLKKLSTIIWRKLACTSDREVQVSTMIEKILMLKKTRRHARMLTRLDVGATHFPKCTKMNFNQLSLQQIRNYVHPNYIALSNNIEINFIN